MAGYMKTTESYKSAITKVLVFVVLILCLPQSSLQSTGNAAQIIDLRDGEEFTMSGSNRFCFRNALVPTWRQAWTRIQVKVWSSKNFKVETVGGEEELQELENFTFWNWLQGFLREQQNETTINISLFSSKTCFRVDPTEKVQFTVRALRKFDIFLFLVFLSGTLLFIFADSLSRSQIFFYSAGMSIGTIASLIIVVYVLGRALPKKGSIYVIIAGGWSVALYAIQLVFRNLKLILQEHWRLALGYVTVVGFVSFAVCYRYGPLVNEKSINILSWTLQLFGLLLIYLGMQIQQVAFAVILAALFSKHLEVPVSLALTTWRKMMQYINWKPVPRRLLTEEEYQKEGEEETHRALEELRKYCNSPEFSPWKAVSRLQSPKRFADFIEGSPHLMPNEASVHAQEYGLGGSFFEDELFDTDDEEEDVKLTSKPE